MFERIHLKDLKSSEMFGYAAELPFFKGRKTLEFKPGLNVLFGPNGSGKSTVLRLLASTMGATQGGLSVVTETLVHETVTLRGFSANRKTTDKIGVRVEHDGQPVVYADPRKPVGLDGSSFDNDFMQAGLVEALQGKRLSHGQQSSSRINAALAVLLKRAKAPTEVKWAMRKENVNDVWVAGLEIVEKRMEPTCERGQLTVILDEPEANFSLKWQETAWAILSKASVRKNFQVIVASHSPFALELPGANYIDFEEGYREELTQMLRAKFGTRGKSSP